MNIIRQNRCGQNHSLLTGCSNLLGMTSPIVGRVCGNPKVRRTYRLITPCKHSAARGNNLLSTHIELRRSSTLIMNNEQRTNMLLNSYGVLYRRVTSTPNCATLVRGYQYSSPSDLPDSEKIIVTLFLAPLAERLLVMTLFVMCRFKERYIQNPASPKDLYIFKPVQWKRRSGALLPHTYRTPKEFNFGMNNEHVVELLRSSVRNGYIHPELRYACSGLSIFKSFGLAGFRKNHRNSFFWLRLRRGCSQ
jgi:hypothetical protein